MTDLKEKLKDGDNTEFSWLETKDMVVDFLTKEKTETVELDKVIIRKKFKKIDEKRNTAMCDGDIVKMLNRTKVSDINDL